MVLVAVVSLFIGVTVIAQHGLKEVHIVTYPITSGSTPTPTQIGPGNDAWHEQYQPVLNDPIIGVTDVGPASAIVANSTATAWPEEPHPIALNFTHTPVKIEAGPDASSHQPHPDDPGAAARSSLDVLFARQSSNIDQATARYSLRTGRPPPRNYDKWFKFAREKSCLIDDYDQIHRDFKPFYDLAQDDPRIFQRRLDVAFDMVRKMMNKVEIKDGKVIMPEFSPHLPDMTFLISGMDQPRVAFNYREPTARRKALALTEKIPFSVSPRPTSTWFEQRPGCNIPRTADVHVSGPNVLLVAGNSHNLVFISSARTEFTVDLYPVLSMSKVSPCFADILFPIEYYYDRSWWSGKFSYPNNIGWKDKKSQICKHWRGSSTGGQIFGSNYRNFPRFKLIDFTRRHPGLVDAALTTWSDELCGPECDRETIMGEYDFTGQGAPREDEYGYKYLLDIDGNAFSGRFLGLLRSGSLVFKATVFEEYFNDWIRPFEHYIPVLPDLSDLLEKLEWARSHDAEARMIQERGREIGERLMTDGQNDCYFFLVLLEWARLQDISRNATFLVKSS
ncbi:glycosyl transferase family 90-domain-containing protein [Mycena albidolilacea]|uniref:Glycosyl transferase family 90-domain-containing protein n=1 Tax=Mycena albidolilacea TaxID=1033008 RepID=A0AAD6ZUF7_9AGAR|nr:glycosyl transferase family 90-domain-containing protein [Mycena albidolilacea]